MTHKLSVWGFVQGLKTIDYLLLSWELELMAITLAMCLITAQNKLNVTEAHWECENIYSCNLLLSSCAEIKKKAPEKTRYNTNMITLWWKSNFLFVFLL